MKAELINGKEISGIIKENLKKEVQALKAEGKTPGLAVILAGNDPASLIYVRGKQKACDEVGVYSKKYEFDENVSQKEIVDVINELNNDKSIHGILVQLPLPDQIDERAVLDSVDPKKDVDGINTANIGKLLTDQSGFVACTPKGIIRLIESTGQAIKGKHAVVVGRSDILGKPVAQLLLNKDATVTICHSKTVDLAAIVKTADIIVAAVGKPLLIKADMIKPGAIVIDGGTTKVDGKLKGDVDFEGAIEIAGYITPVPGGVGPMTITMLIENTIEACKQYG